ncbi:aldo/keto reductase [Halomarina oriensis]|uniref:Aldo/keto reductase n=1 Tax=Halomarina oriensis TaxID=671145 RepID=A0A6B0GIX7_9EURY|nr:aldo/keto reductase [Halomarina oriensis]
MYTTLGGTGLSVSRLCLGTARFGRAVNTDRTRRLDEQIIDRETAHDLLDTAFDQGVNFIDTANSYGRPVEGRAERYIGEWLDGRDRESVVVASKVYGDMGDGPNDAGLSRKHVRAQLRGTLDRLGTDYVDIYYLHRWDDDTPITETLSTLDDAVRAGRVHHIGLSTAAAWQLVKAQWTSDVNGWEPVSITQPKYNAVHRAPVAPYLDACVDSNVGICVYSPLAGGFLTGKYERSTPEPSASRASRDRGFLDRPERDWRVLDTIRTVAEELDATPTQVALAWLLAHERHAAFTPIPVVGPRTVDQLRDNLSALSLSLPQDAYSRISDAYGHVSETAR